MVNVFSSGIKYNGPINQTLYEKVYPMAKEILLTGTVRGEVNNTELENIRNKLPLVTLLLTDPMNGESARAFATVIMERLKQRKELDADHALFNPSLVELMRTIGELAKTWSFGHTYVNEGNKEIPAWFFRHQELFVYHMVLELVVMMNKLSYAEIKQCKLSYGVLAKGIEACCLVAKGLEMVLPMSSHRDIKCAGALHVLVACEAVEHSLINDAGHKLKRGHVAFAMVMANEALYKTARDPLSKDNLFAHFFVSGTALNFMRRVGAFAEKLHDKAPAKIINDVDLEMCISVVALDAEVVRLRKKRERVLEKRRHNTPNNPESKRARVTDVTEKMTPRELFGSDSSDDAHASPSTPPSTPLRAASGTTTRPQSPAWTEHYKSFNTKGYWRSAQEGMENTVVAAFRESGA